MTGATVHGSRPLVYGWVRGVRVHAVSAVTGRIDMVNVSAWLTGGLGKKELGRGQESLSLVRARAALDLTRAGLALITVRCLQKKRSVSGVQTSVQI